MLNTFFAVLFSVRVELSPAASAGAGLGEGRAECDSAAAIQILATGFEGRAAIHRASSNCETWYTQYS